MATVGQQLTLPEVGWQRIDDTSSFLKYTGNWIVENASAHYNSTQHYSPNNAIGGAKISFKFKGTKLRLGSYNSPAYRISDVKVTIDGVVDTVSAAVGSEGPKVIFYERLGLSNSLHTVEVWNGAATTSILSYGLDWLDIDSDGYMRAIPETPGSLKSSVTGMQIGDYIACKYTATSGVVGSFSDFGGMPTAEIPTGGTATPDGYFYFVKAARGVLIADRIVQTGISYDLLNASGLLEGSSYLIATPIMTSNTTPSGEASASVVTQGMAANVFNRTLGGWTDRWFVDTFNSRPQRSVWVQYKFPTARVITALELYCVVGDNGTGPSRAPGGFTLSGSNDGIDFTEIGTWSDIAGYVEYVPKLFEFTNNTAYLYYRFTVLSTVSSSEMEIGELYLLSPVVPRIPKGKVKSPYGGGAQTDNFGNPTLLYFPNKGWPASNEFDSYISNFSSVQEGKTTDDVFHSNALWTYCRNTIISGNWQRKDGVMTGAIGSNFYVARSTSVTANPQWGTIAPISSAVAATDGGFRPVLEYEEG